MTSGPERGRIDLAHPPGTLTIADRALLAAQRGWAGEADERFWACFAPEWREALRAGWSDFGSVFDAVELRGTVLPSAAADLVSAPVFDSTLDLFPSGDAAMPFDGLIAVPAAAGVPASSLGDRAAVVPISPAQRCRSAGARVHVIVSLSSFVPR